MYREQALLDILGAPTVRGHLIGDGSAGFAETPWSNIKRVPLGPDLHMTWECVVPAPTDERSPRCEAISPRSARSPLYQADDQDRWYIVESCPEHRQKFVLTPFEEIFPQENDDDDLIEPDIMLLVVDSKSYIDDTGPDWEKLDERLRAGWRKLLVAADHRVPGYHFVVLQRPGGGR